MQDNTQNPPTQPPPRDWRLLVVAALSFALVWFVLANSFNDPGRTPMRYLFPEGFVGKYNIQMGVKTAAPLPVEDGYLLVQIPKDGQLQTATVVEYGVAKDEFYFVSPAGTRKAMPHYGENSLVHSESITIDRDTGKPESQTGFIGTEEQVRESG